MTKRLPDASFSRRRFVKAAGGAAAGAFASGLMPTPFKRLLRPVGLAEAADQPPNLFFAGTDGWIYATVGARDCAVSPGRVRACAVHDVYLWLPQPDRARRRRSIEPEEQGPALRAFLLGESIDPADTDVQAATDQSRPGACAPTCPTRTPCTGTASATRSRSSTASRPDPSRCRPAAFHLRLPPARRRHLHVPLPRRRRRARAHGHDRARLRAPRQNGNTAFYPSGKYAYNDGDGATGLRPRIRRCSSPRCGPRRTGRTRTSSFPTGATTAPTSRC